MFLISDLSHVNNLIDEPHSGFSFSDLHTRISLFPPQSRSCMLFEPCGRPLWCRPFYFYLNFVKIYKLTIHHRVLFQLGNKFSHPSFFGNNFHMSETKLATITNIISVLTSRIRHAADFCHRLFVELIALAMAWFIFHSSPEKNQQIDYDVHQRLATMNKIQMNMELDNPKWHSGSPFSTADCGLPDDLQYLMTLQSCSLDTI